MRNQEGENYLRWYFDSLVWTKTSFSGVPCLKSVSDMWNYQEIITALRPTLIVEFGVHKGGSSLFFATVSGLINPQSQVLCVDVDLSTVDAGVREHSRIRWMESNSVDRAVERTIRELREQILGPMFVVVDSDHSQKHVTAELELLRHVTVPGDYVVVEDSILNGHPVWPAWGGGPWEAIEEYTTRYPDDYLRDAEREEKFGFTFAPRGFLIRR